MLQKILDDFDLIAKALKQQALLKDLNEKRNDWERRSALFVPSKQRLERGRKALELGEDYENIKELRESREKNKIKQASLIEDMNLLRTGLQNSDEALTLSEVEYRDKLVEQTKLQNTIQKVKSLDEQLAERQDAAVHAKIDFEESEKKFRECSKNVEKEQTFLERLELSLREARKFLQIRSIDEKLQSGLTGIQKCFNLYEQAEEKRIHSKDLWAKAIQKKQEAQSGLNDRAALFTDVIHRFAVAEKNYVRARAFYESTLKGKTLTEWRDICEKNIMRLSALDELYKKFQDEKVLQEKLRHFQELRLKIQQETRNLNLRDVEQTGKIHELQNEVNKLERRVALLHRIEDLDAVRELLQDGIACPLCGSMTHPYVSGAIVPDPEEVHNQLHEAQKSLDNLRDELTNRQTKAGKLSDEISSVGRDESDVRKNLNELSAEISSRVSNLGIRMAAGISPFEEIDRARQKTRDQLQLARNTADTAETAERNLKNASDELDKIKETREELTRYHQEALFLLQSEKSEEERFEGESKTQEEITASLKRELISQLVPYGYKTLPDKNPETVIEALKKRLTDWQDGVKKRDELERDLSVAQTKMSDLKKERDASKLKRDEALSSLKATEAERDSIQQQRIIVFASKNPETEKERMNRDVENLRRQLDEKRDEKNKNSVELERIMTSIHNLETEMSVGRDQLQRYEINFGKKLLALGFKNEDDYLSACLRDDERKELQETLKELSQTDIEISSMIENVKAKLLELNGGFNAKDFSKKISELEKKLNEEYLILEKNNDQDSINLYQEKFIEKLKPEIQNLALKCGLPEPFEN